MNRLYLAACCFSAVVTFGCGPKEFGSVCTEVPAPAACMTACDPAPGAANACPAGFHCGPNGTCDAQCITGDGKCGEGYVCTSDGYCVADGSGSGELPIDASCPSINFTPMPTTPSISLVLDQSGSMFPPSSNRYTQMRDALVGTNGVVVGLETKAYFGSLLYTCSGSNNAFTQVPRALNNAAAIRTSIDSKTNGENTPTPQAIDAAVAAFQASPAPAGSPPVIVLATDGLPNTCPDSNADTRTQSVASARAAFAAGIPVYVLAINQNNQHFQDLANAGQGWVAGQPNVTYYPVTNAAQLQAAFSTIINGVISCDLTLTSAIDPAQAMNGKVTVNGTVLTFGTDWTLVAPGNNVIRLQGSACTMLKTSVNPMVAAQFPCGSVIF